MSKANTLTDSLLQAIDSRFSLKALEVGQFAQMKVSGMTFSISAYHAQGLGHVSLMKAKGFFGLMKMDTLVIVPQEKDLPLYSYDRIQAMGNESLYLELYDTVAGKFDTSNLDEIKTKYAGLPDFDPGKHWYDNIKLSQSLFKKAKKDQGPAFDSAALDFLKAYLKSGNDTSGSATDFDTAAKRQKSQYYVNGLLQNGGPSTDVFLKKFGVEKTAEFFKKVLFGTELS